MFCAALVIIPILLSFTHAQLTPFTRTNKAISESIEFSEEPPSTSYFQSELVAGMKCFGHFCDNKKLITVRDGLEYPVTSTGFQSEYFSTNGLNSANCPPDMVLSQVWCRGIFCDDLRIGCGRLSLGYVINPREVLETNFFSEENGGTQFCPDSYYIKGLACAGRFCDFIRLICVRVYHSPFAVNSCDILANARDYLIRGKYFSEEGGGLSELATEPVVGLACSGHFCDNKRLITLQPASTMALSSSTFWTRWFSEEGINFARCPAGMIVNRVQCGDHFCDNIRLGCGGVSSSYRVEHTDVKTNFFSEEQGEELCPAGHYVFGMACASSFCDFIQLHCARVKCA